MSRSKSWIAIAAIIFVATALAAVAVPQNAEAASVKGKLRFAKRALRHSNFRLKTAEAALAAAVAATDSSLAVVDTTATPTPAAAPVTAATTMVDVLETRVVKARRAVHRWKHRVHRLARQYRVERTMAEWERRGKWRPIIEVAAAKYHVSADGIHRMMMRESGGQRYAGARGAFKGLFQYHTGTWAADWNPYRHDSIYDGSSQIFATCYAVSKGMGPSMWTTTFASLY